MYGKNNARDRLRGAARGPERGRAGRGRHIFLFGALAMAVGCGDAPEAGGTEEPRAAGSALPARAERGDHDDMAELARRFPATVSLADRFLRDESALAHRTIASAIAVHRPDVEGPAYLEFTLRDANGDAGYVLASTAGDDFPIVAWTDRGAGIARTLAQRSRASGRAAKIYTIGLGAYVAELVDGSVVSETAELTGDEWSVRKEKVRRASQRTVERVERAKRAWQRVARRTGIALPTDVAPWPADARDACDPDSYDAAECRAAQDGVETLARGADLLFPPNYAQFAGTFDNGSCKVGCVPNAFAQIAAWCSHQAGDHRDGSVWGHPRIAYAFNGPSDVWAPISHDGDLASVTTEFRQQLGTTCSGNSGLTSYFPYDRISDLGGQLFNRIGAPVNTTGIYNASWDTYARVIDDSLLRTRVPVEVNAMTDPWGNSAHAWVVWGYRSDAFGEAYRVNMGWSSHEAGEWVSKGSVLGALTSSFTHGIDGSGVVVFSPQDLGRDHGPITTAGGTCIDVEAAPAGDGSVVGQTPCHDGEGQLWYLDRTSSADLGWQIRSRSRGTCLAAAFHGEANGASVIQTPCDRNDTNTIWRIEKHGARVALRHHVSGRCVDLDTATDGSALHMWECGGGANQLFDFAK